MCDVWNGEQVHSFQWRGLNEEEFKELVKGVHTKQKQKKANKENVDCEAQVDQLLMKVCDGDIADKMISGDFWLALVDALKQDEKELWAKHIWLKGNDVPLWLLCQNM